MLSLAESGKFVIQKEQEDCHTAIEAYLTEHYGEV
jgi:argininosuccinate lyase